MLKTTCFLYQLVLFFSLGVPLFLSAMWGKNTPIYAFALVGRKSPDFTLVSLETDTTCYAQRYLPDGPYLINFWEPVSLSFKRASFLVGTCG